MADTDPIWPRTGMYIRRKNGDHFYAALLPDEATVAISVDELAGKTGVFDNAIAFTDDGILWLWDEDSIEAADGVSIVGANETGRWKAQQSGGGGTSATGYDFIFYAVEGAQPPVYSDWAALYAAASALPGVKRVHVVTDLLLDDELASFSFIGAGGELFLSSGATATLTDGTLQLENLIVRGDGSSIAVVGESTLLADGVRLEPGTSAVFDAADAVLIVVGHRLDMSGSITAPGAINSDNGGVDCELFDHSSVSAYSFSGLNTEVTVEADASCRLPTPLTNAQPFVGITGSADVTLKVNRSGEVTNTVAFSADLNNFGNSSAFRAGGGARFIRFEPSTSGLKLTGVAAALAGSAIDCANVASDGFTIQHQNAGSVAGARFICPGGVDFTAAAGATWRMRYDPVSSRWRIWP